jgi:uncharacterized protein YjhX (UPF0386 family)
MNSLSSAQQAALAAICKTNGGGVPATSFNLSTVRSLVRKGLVQGKSGMNWRVVHTSEGLKAYRETQNG